MTRKNDKGKKSKLDSFIELFKKIRFVVLAIGSVVILCVALLSGDGRKLFSTFYEKVTGINREVFSPIEDFSTESYLILKDTLSRNQDFRFEELECRYLFFKSKIQNLKSKILNLESQFCAMWLSKESIGSKGQKEQDDGEGNQFAK